MNNKLFPLLSISLIGVMPFLNACGTTHPTQISTPFAPIDTPVPLLVAPSTTMTPSPTAPPTATSTPSPITPPTATSTPSPTSTNAPTSTPTPEPTQGLPPATPLPDDSLLLTFDTIDIIGTQAFINLTTQALSLLQNQSPESYQKIKTYVGVIQQDEHSGMWAAEDPPRYAVGERTAEYSTTWYASTIAHDATHSELYHEYIAQHGEPVPDAIWASVAAEQFCIAYQLKVLKEIGGPANEVDYLATQTGTHCDVDNDGDCDWDDYENRGW